MTLNNFDLIKKNAINTINISHPVPIKRSIKTEHK